MSECLCPDCGTDLNEQSSYLGYDHICEECGAKLHRRYSSDDFEIVPDQYLCPCCGASLYAQSCYSDYEDNWTCEECGRRLHRDYSFDPYSIVTDDDEDGEYSSSCSSSGDVKIGLGGGLLIGTGIAIAGIASALFGSGSQSSNEVNHYSSQSKSGVSDNSWKVGLIICITLFALVGLLVCYLISVERMKYIDVGIDIDQVIGLPHETVMEMFTEAGFANVSIEETQDLSLEDEHLTGTVASVTINGTKAFHPNDQFSREANIVIYYHVLKLISAPVSAKDAKGKNYETILQQFKDVGFVNIKVEAKFDLILGWFSQEGEIAEIIINGDDKFKTDVYYRPDVEIIIVYHDYKKNAE